MTGPAGAPAVRRLAAAGALVLGALGVAVAAVALWGDVLRAALVPLLVLVVVAAGWSAATRTGSARAVAATVCGLAAVGALLVVLTAERRGVSVAVVAALLVASVAAARFALGEHEDHPVGVRVGPAVRGALLMNPRSGGGKVLRFDLEGEARRRGIEPIVLGPGDDLLALARGAIDRGVDVLGMAGGDGSQALVASVAREADVALVCVPAGTRNHFALDLGLDREAVVDALDAFGEAVERRIDLAAVGERIFVNNVSLGVYAAIVQSPEYRDAKVQTTARLLPELLGPDAEPFGLRFRAPDGVTHDGAQVVQVSNNAYTFSLLGGFGTRASLDGGLLGISTMEVRGATEAARAAAAMTAGHPERFHGWSEWAAPELVVDADGPVAAGVDGEALTLDPPLVFRSLPGAIRVRVPTDAPGSSPAARRSRSVWWSVTELVGLAAGRPTRTP